MELSEIQSNVKRIKAELATGNPFGEKVLLVAATKTQSADAINAAIDAGVVDTVEFHIAPKLLGGRDSRPVLGGNNPESMEFARKLHNVKVTHYGEDIVISGDLEE